MGLYTRSNHWYGSFPGFQYIDFWSLLCHLKCKIQPFKLDPSSIVPRKRLHMVLHRYCYRVTTLYYIHSMGKQCYFLNASYDRIPMGTRCWCWNNCFPCIGDGKMSS